MSKSAKKAADQAEREKVHKRYSNRREPDVIYPARKQVDFYDADVHQRVAVYVRVSTDNLGQETSYELQKNYYEEFVLKHPNWSLVKIYADKGISGTSTKHRVALNQMLADSRAGKIDLIITKSVSRLARNTVDCITMVRNLTELRNPVGVFFESECIFSLNEDTSMPLSFLASIAENESRIRSRSMEVSLAQRLNGGLPLTPKLLGYGVTKLDGIVEKVIRMKFAEIVAAPESEILNHQHKKEIELARIKLDQANAHLAEKQKDLSDYKAETLKVIRGQSNLSVELLNALVKETETMIALAQTRIDAAQTEYESLLASAENLRQEYDRLLTWADLFDTCSFEAKKMIVAQFVKAVRVSRDYNIEIDFNVSFEEFQNFSVKNGEPVILQPLRSHTA